MQTTIVPQHDLIPGTEVLVDHEVLGRHVSERDIVLVPQPSDDPSDPLNWSPRWKASVIFSMVLVTFAQTLGPLAISPIFPILVKEFHASLEDTVQLTGITILLLGFGNWVWVPLGDVYGRRIVLLMSQVLTIVGALWRGLATSYTSFFAASIILGAGTAIAVAPGIVSDVIFLHKRGFYNTIFFATFFSGVMLGPIFQGAMAQRVGWRSFWYLVTALNVVAFFYILFAFPETKWVRKQTRQAAVGSGKIHADERGNVKREGSPQATEISAGEESVILGRPSKEQFRLFRTYNNVAKTLAIGLVLPLKLLTVPIILWAGLMQSFSSTCYLIITFLQAKAFTAPPYNFNTESVGFVSFASFVGALIGLFTAGKFSDWISMKMTIRNRGVREPEFRLLALIPYSLVMLLGNFIAAFGWQHGWDWRAIVIVGYGCAGIQATAISGIAATYAIDSYKPVATPIFLIVTLARELWGFGVSKFVIQWVTRVGYIPIFMLNMGFLCLWLLVGAVFYFTGKKLRYLSRNSWVHRYSEDDL